MVYPIPLAQLKKTLVHEGLITTDRFEALSREAESKKQNLLDILVSGGIVSASYLNDLLAKYLGVELADLGNRAIDENIIRLIPEDIARQRQVIIFNREPDGGLDAAMLDPGDLETIEFLKQRLKTEIKPFLATAEDLNRGFSIYGFRLAQDFRVLLEQEIQKALRGGAEKIEEAAAQLPIVAIVDNLITYATSIRASDVHIEVLEEAILVRYRIDGILYEILRMPKAVHPAILARIKLLSGLKLDEHTRPQDGRFRYQLANKLVDVRVSVIPTFYGEKMEMRLLEAAQKPLSLEELGFLPEMVQVINRGLKQTYGLFLSCGPTGSGKTTTLYALISILNRPEVNIISIEDPIEYNIRYANQMQINPAAGITFASGLRSILRQDPNIVMVGEIRDAETAGIAVQAALTGHLLLSSLHTNDAATAIPRLFDLEVPPFLAASVLNLIIAQRLARKLCPVCIYSYELTGELNRLISEQLRIFRVNNFQIPKILYRSRGCPSCNNAGYRGRIGIFEVIEISDKIKQVIIDPQFDLNKLRETAQAGGMKTMFEDGLQKAILGLTDIEEVLRVIRE